MFVFPPNLYADLGTYTKGPEVTSLCSGYGLRERVLSRSSALVRGAQGAWFTLLPQEGTEGLLWQTDGPLPYAQTIGTAFSNLSPSRSVKSKF